MTRYLVDKGHDIISYKGRFYGFGPEVDLRNGLGNMPQVREKLHETARDLGAVILEAGEFVCSECQHNTFTDLLGNFFTDPNLHMIVSDDVKAGCRYEIPSDGPHWLSYFYKKREVGRGGFFSKILRKNGETGFAARMNPCVMDTALVQVLAEEGVLDRYLISDPGVDPVRFPIIRDVKKGGSESLKNAIEQYALLRKR